MIYDRFSRRRSNKQFNRCSLNAQDKIKLINQIREERSANSVYISSATYRVYVQSLSNPLEIFTTLVKFFYNF